uniref:acetyl-coenzyme A synthetase N-terminal domain-containing protein n=1 Tax=Metallibacterium sp. TaxID=2940281 RepID=UPI002637E1EB
MSKVYPVPTAFAAAARVRADDYARLYADSVRDPAGFWREVARRLDWMRFPTRIKDTSFARADFHIRWYADGVLNV